MKPAFSIILFTTIAGAAQGLVVVLALAMLAGRAPAASSAAAMSCVAVAMLVVALAASFFHLGHPLRAWRAVMMWRTSWMSREVIVLPAFIVTTAAWAYLMAIGSSWAASAIVCLVQIALAVLLWWCTAMIYACIRFIQEWAHPLTMINFAMLGLSSGLVVACALSVVLREAAFVRLLAPWAAATTMLAWLARGAALRRNARLVARSTIQSATGIRSSRVAQVSMGLTGSSFNLREFFHGAPAHVFEGVRFSFQVLAFAVPVVLVAAGMVMGAAWAVLLAAPVQWAGLVAERWFFFAQARHPQNIYYQVVS